MPGFKSLTNDIRDVQKFKRHGWLFVRHKALLIVRLHSHQKSPSVDADSTSVLTEWLAPLNEARNRFIDPLRMSDRPHVAKLRELNDACVRKCAGQ